MKLTLSELCDRLLLFCRPVIVLHARPDGDATGSAYALSAIYRMLGREARCLCADPIPRRLSFLTEEGAPCLTPETLSEYDYDGVISIDVGAVCQLGGVDEILTRAVDIMIDHHSKGEPFADYYINKKAAAAGEIIYDIACELISRGALDRIDTQMGTGIYAAISSDTGCFKFSNVTARTHRIAADLIDLGVPYIDINRQLFDSKSHELLSAERIALENLRFYNSGSISICAITNSDKITSKLNDEHFATSVDIARSIEGVMVGVAIKEIDRCPGSFRISMRANGDIDVAEICAHFGGGGHLRAAGCTIERESIDEAVCALLEKMGLSHETHKCDRL